MNASKPRHAARGVPIVFCNQTRRSMEEYAAAMDKIKPGAAR